MLLVGHVICGGVVSATAMICVHELELPELSVAVQVRAITWPPLQLGGNRVSLHSIKRFVSQLSVALLQPLPQNGDMDRSGGIKFIWAHGLGWHWLNDMFKLSANKFRSSLIVTPFEETSPPPKARLAIANICRTDLP